MLNGEPRFNWWHIYPTQDRPEHVTDNSGPCWCNPWLDTVLDQAGEPVGVQVLHRRAAYWTRDHWMPEPARYWHSAN